jgi:hypothetical protein
MRSRGCKPGSSQLLSHHAGCDRERVFRRLKPASFELTMSSLRQAWLLGRLHRTSPVPFRGSSFTADSIFGSYAPTTHRLPAQPMRLRSILPLSSIPPVRFVTHPCTPSLRRAAPSQKPGGVPPRNSRIPSARIRSLRLPGGPPHLPRSLRPASAYLCRRGPSRPCVLDFRSPLKNRPSVPGDARDASQPDRSIFHHWG